MIENYNQAISYIEEKGRIGIVPGLDNIKKLLFMLGNPQDKLRVLHIAGTNGKGSIFSFVQNALVKSGYKVGRYISPTIFSYLERFQTTKDGKITYMDENTFARILDKVAYCCETMVSEGLPSPTSFEIETAVYFVYMVEENVDYALVECGMGGKEDATNVMSHSDISVFASISLDHMQFLGDTLTKIAETKSGIIKSDSVCISAPQPKEVEEVLRKKCIESNTRFLMVDKGAITLIKTDIDGTRFKYSNEEYEISLLGDYQLINASVAIEVLKELNITNENIVSGIKDTIWPGRFTLKSKKPLVIIDGAHNEAAWKELSVTLNNHFTNIEFVFIIGVLRDKEYERMVDILAPYMKEAIAITPDSPRALSKEELKVVLEKSGVKTVTADSPEEAIAMTNGSDVMICGSLSFLKPYLEMNI